MDERRNPYRRLTRRFTRKPRQFDADGNPVATDLTAHLKAADMEEEDFYRFLHNHFRKD